MKPHWGLALMIQLYGASIVAQEDKRQESTWHWQLAVTGLLVIEDASSIQNALESKVGAKDLSALYGFRLEVEKNNFFLGINYGSGTTENENHHQQIVLQNAIYSVALGYSWYPWGRESVRVAPHLGYLYRTMDMNTIMKGNTGVLVPILPSSYAGYSDSFVELGLRIGTYTKHFGEFFLFPARIGVVVSGAQSLDIVSWQGKLQNGMSADYQLMEKFLSLSAIISWNL